MPISLSCHQCRRQLKVKDELAGKQIFCPDCKSVLNVPASAENYFARSQDPYEPPPAPPLPANDPYADRLDLPKPPPPPPPPPPEPESTFDRAPPPRLEPASSGSGLGRWGGVLGGLGLMALAVVVLVGGIAIGILPVKLVIILFIVGVITFFRGLFVGD